MFTLRIKTNAYDYIIQKKCANFKNNKCCGSYTSLESRDKNNEMAAALH